VPWPKARLDALPHGLAFGDRYGSDGDMYQIRIHGRGGQGVVSGAEMLSVAAFLEGRYAQAFPTFGAERMGTRVTAFCRIDDREIRSREPVHSPDALIIQDPTLLHEVDLFDGLQRKGCVLINSAHSFEELGLGEFTRAFRPAQLCMVAATDIALKHVGLPLPNAALLGAFAALSGQLKLSSVLAAIRAKFPRPIAEANVAAAREAHALAGKAEEAVHA
jgi:pyruvate ferredoxin oxidoreductase gamma subunit